MDTKIAKRIGDKIGVDWSKIDLNEFASGLDEEFEHGSRDSETNVTNDDPLLTGKIAWAHLKEDPKYYSKLKKVMKMIKRVDLSGNFDRQSDYQPKKPRSTLVKNGDKRIRSANSMLKDIESLVSSSQPAPYSRIMSYRKFCADNGLQASARALTGAIIALDDRKDDEYKQAMRSAAQIIKGDIEKMTRVVGSGKSIHVKARKMVATKGIASQVPRVIAVRKFVQALKGAVETGRVITKDQFLKLSNGIAGLASIGDLLQQAEASANGGDRTAWSGRSWSDSIKQTSELARYAASYSSQSKIEQYGEAKMSQAQSGWLRSIDSKLEYLVTDIKRNASNNAGTFRRQ